MCDSHELASCVIQKLSNKRSEFDYILNLMQENMSGYHEQIGVSWDSAWIYENYIKNENYVIVKCKQNIGFLSIETIRNSLFVHTVQVQIKFQNQRVGLYVLRMILNIMLIRNLQIITCKVFKDSPVLKIYQRLGFSIIAEEKHFFTLNYDINSNSRLQKIAKLSF